MTLKHWAAFFALADTRGWSKAAEGVRLTQPTVTHSFNLTYQKYRCTMAHIKFQESYMKTNCCRALVLSMLLLLAGCATTVGTSPKGLEIPIEKAAVKLVSDVKEGGYKVVGTEELKKWLDDNRQVTLISTLPAEDDKLFGLLPAAVNGMMPKSEKELTQADTDNLLKVAGEDRDKTFVLYCGFVACRRSHLGAKTLVENGFKNVYRYPAGVVGWKEAGYALVK